MSLLVSAIVVCLFALLFLAPTISRAQAQQAPATVVSDVDTTSLVPQVVTNHANLVVVVRFSDDTTGNGATGYNAANAYNASYTVWNQFIAWFNSGTSPDYFDQTSTSLQAYMQTISNGTYSVTSYFPQTNFDGKTMTYITLPHNQSYYEGAGDLQLVEDAAVVFNANAVWTAGSSNWGSGGSLDNLELVVQVESEPATSDTLLWPHKSDASGAISFGGMRVYEYNMVNSRAVADGGTVKHEYLHTVGLGDLYRVGDTSNAVGPVGIWDIMGSAAGQFPLAQSLVDLGFSSGIAAVSGAGEHTVTLTTHYPTNGQQAIKVASPYSSDEYFVFEYRKRDRTNILSSDYLVPSSGLIAYRVNTAIDTDGNGHHTNRNKDASGNWEDYLYVFRPGETGIHDSAGTLMEAALSTSTYAYLGGTGTYGVRTSFGQSDMSKTITDGAIVDSQDRNSGITVTVTAQTDDSITFTLTIPDYSTLDTWAPVANADGTGAKVSTGQADGIDITTDSSGNTYLAFYDRDANTGGGTLKVRKYDGSNWSDLGTVATGSLLHPNLDMVGTTLYCTYASYPESGTGNSVVTRGWDGSAWREVATVSTGSSYSNSPVTCVIDGSLYLLVDKDSTSVQLYRLDVAANGASYSAIGSALPFGSILDPQLLEFNDSPCIVCGDYTSGTLTRQTVYLLENGVWQTFCQGSGGHSYYNAAVVGSNGQTERLITFSAGVDSHLKALTPQINSIAEDGSVTNYDIDLGGITVSDACMTISGSTVYLTTVDGDGLCITRYADMSSLDTWTQLGEATVSAASSATSVINGGSVLVGYIHKNYSNVGVVSHALAKVPATAATWTRLAGDNRYATMSAIVHAGFKDNSCDTVILATGSNFPDALAASGLAGLHGCPIVLTDGTADLLGEQAKAEITRLGATRVIIAGGENTVSPGIYTELANLYKVGSLKDLTRIYGSNRVETALGIYDAGKSVTHRDAADDAVTGWGQTVIIATSRNFADALSISPFSWANAAPILLTSQDGAITDKVASTLEADHEAGKLSHVIIAGGVASVSIASEDWLKGVFGADNVVRLAGASRYVTSKVIADFSCGQGDFKDYPTAFGYTTLSYIHAAVATGQDFPDALAGGTFCGKGASVLLLMDDAKATTDVNRLICMGGITANKDALENCSVLGGTKSISDDLKASLIAASSN